MRRIHTDDDAYNVIIAATMTKKTVGKQGKEKETHGSPELLRQILRLLHVCEHPLQLARPLISTLAL